MSKLTKARKREIRESVCQTVACNIREMDSKCFEGIGENTQEDQYALDFAKSLAERLLYKPTDKPVGEANE